MLLRDGGPETKAAVQLAPTGLPISGVSLSDLTLTDNPYHGLSVHGTKTLTNATATGLQVGTVGLSGTLSYGVEIEPNLATGGTLAVSDSAVGEYHNETPTFRLTLTSVTGALPSPWIAGDVNALSTGTRGTTAYAGGAFAVAGAGTGIRSTADGFRFVSQNVSGDHTIGATVGGLTGTTPTAGLMFRDDMSAGSPYVGLFFSSTGSLVLQSRSGANGSTTTTKTITGVKAPVQLKLTRVGNVFTASYLLNGVWTPVGSVTVALATASNAGLAVTSGNKSQTGSATFSNVSVTP